MPRRGRFCAALHLVAALVLALPLVSRAQAPAGAGHTACDALCSRVLTELANFTGWLQRNQAQGFIGEVGWPDDRRGDGTRWAQLAEAWFDNADEAGLWVTSWATGEWWGTQYPLTPYEDRTPGGGVDSTDIQAGVLERHATRGGVLRGVNVAGAEFAAPAVDATSSFSNHNPGTYDVAYHYDTQATFDYLAGRGVKLVRLPVRWERLQRAPYAALDASEVGRLRAALDRAGRSGLRVVLDVHNYGGYYLFDGSRGLRRTIGSAELPITAFSDLWSRISAGVGDVPSLAGYGLMNEPVGLPSLGGQPAARTWEQASQAAVDAVRARGDRRPILVAGYEWSGAQRWSQQHPSAWVRDTAGQIVYEAHHYWDRDNSGQYARTYQQELDDARARGFTDTGSSPLKSEPARWSGWDIARDVALRADGISGYVLDGFGGVHPFGGAPSVASGAYWPGWDIARDIVLRPDGKSGYVLDGWGGIHAFGGAPAVSTGVWWQGWDIAREMVLDLSDPSAARGYVLDGWGGIHPFGGAPAVVPGAYWHGWDIANDMALRADGRSGYVLDGWGGIHPFGGAPAVSTGVWWQGWDIARAMVLRPDGVSGYVLDGWGGIHPFGGAPAVHAGPYWPRWDIARGFAAGTVGDSGHVLDGWGGVHEFLTAH